MSHKPGSRLLLLSATPAVTPAILKKAAGDMSHKPDGKLPLQFAKPAITPATLKGAATNFAAW